MMTDEQLYNIERKQSFRLSDCRPFRLKCSIFDIVGFEYIIDVEFKEIIDDVFEAHVLGDIPFTAEHVFEDVNNYFKDFIDDAKAHLQRVYDNFNNEIK